MEKLLFELADQNFRYPQTYGLILNIKQMDESKVWHNSCTSSLPTQERKPFIPVIGQQQWRGSNSCESPAEHIKNTE